jgi:hypothetical protein
MIQLYVLSISDASGCNVVMITPLISIVSRSASAKMVDGNLHRCYFAVDEEDALWHAIPRSRNSCGSQSEFFKLNLSTCLSETYSLEQIPRCLRRGLRCLHWPPRLLSLHQPGDYVSRPIFSCLWTLTLSVSVSSTPETFDIVSSTVDVSSRKNLAQISKVLSQVTSGSEFGDDTPSYIPINEYVKGAILQITSWLFEGRYSHECILSCIESVFSCQRP